MSDFAFLIRRIRELQNEVERTNNALANLNARHERMFRYGKVKDVDSENHRYRQIIDVDGDDKEVLSDWIPYSQIAGTRKNHTPPSEGQQMLMISVDGDHTISFGVPLTWHEKNPSPSTKGDEDVDLRGKTRITQRDADLKIEVDGVTFHRTKQSTKTTIHKPPETKEEGKDETVDDEHPWKGNRAKEKHVSEFNHDGGYTLTVNKGDDQKEHKIVVKPGDDAVEISTHKGKHKITIKKDDVKISAHNGQHETTYESSGIKHKSSSKVTVEAPQIQHQGDVQVSGSFFAQGVVQSSAGFNGPVGNMSPGDPGSATTW